MMSAKYDEADNPTLTKDGESRPVETEYDLADRPVIVRQADTGSTTGPRVVATVKYDLNGNLIESNDGRVTMRMGYDALDRVARATSGKDNEVSSTVYFANGLVRERANPKGDKTTFEYNALGSLVKTTDALNHFWTFEYDDTQNLEKMTDARRKETTYEIHPKLNRVESVTLPMNRKTIFTYDEVDNVKTVTNPLDQVTENVYDDLNRVEKTTFRPKLGEVSFGIRELRYTYTDAGDVTDVEERFENRTLGSLSRFVSMKYDARHRVTEEKRINPLENNVARVVSYDYDKSDRVLKVTDATGRQVGYDYDSAGRLEAVREDGAIRARYNYTSNGLIDRVTYVQNSGVTYSYDDSNRVSGVTHRRLNGAILQEYIYHYDRNGNRVEELILRDGQLRRSGLFGYDRVNRLNQVTYGSRTVEYDYDEVGNRIREHNLQANTLRDFSYDDANRLTGVTQNGQAIAAYQWDAAGNVTQATESGVTWFYSYDLRQQMTMVRKQATTGPPTFAGEYEYDYAKRRIGRNGVWNVYDGDDLLNEFSSAPSTQNSALNSYTYGNELIRSTRDGESFADAQGSVTLTSNGPLKFTEYGAFGEVIATDHEESHIGYTGQFFDNETGLMPLGNGERYYSPLLGRFLQEDSYSGMPDMPWSLNRYSYAFNNPFGFTDPSGNEAEGSNYAKEGYIEDAFQWAHKKNDESLGNRDGIFWWARLYGHFALNNIHTIYEMVDKLSGGFIHREDRLLKNYFQGKISGFKLIEGHLLNTFISKPLAAANIFLTFGTGGSGAAARAAGATAVGKYLAKMTGAGALLGAAEMLGDDVFNKVTYGEKFHSLGQYAEAAGYGALFGLGAGILNLKPGVIVEDSIGGTAKEPFQPELPFGEGPIRSGPLQPELPFGEGPVRRGGSVSEEPIAPPRDPNHPWLPFDGEQPSQPKFWNEKNLSYTNEELQYFIDQIHTASFGQTGGGGIPMTLTISPLGRITISKVGSKPGQASIQRAIELLGQGNFEVVTGTTKTHGPGPKGFHSEPRGAARLADEAFGSKQASSHYACIDCELFQKANNIENITGYASQHLHPVTSEPIISRPKMTVRPPSRKKF